MCVVYHTDIAGVITVVIDEEDPMPTAAAMVRDLVDIVSASKCGYWLDEGRVRRHPHTGEREKHASNDCQPT
jgi:hypothetical protein